MNILTLTPTPTLTLTLKVYLGRWRAILSGDVMRWYPHLTRGDESYVLSLLRFHQLPISRFPSVAALGCCSGRCFQALTLTLTLTLTLILTLALALALTLTLARYRPDARLVLHPDGAQHGALT